MTVVAVFHARFRSERDWLMLRRKLAALSWVDGICMVVDRPDDYVRARLAEEMTARPDDSPHVLRLDHQPDEDIPDLIDGCEHCDEGAMRQRAWDTAGRVWSPDWVILGDLDEWPTPDIVDFLAQADPRVDVYYLPMLNMLSPDGARAITGKPPTRRAYAVSGDCVYASDHPAANRKGILCRRRPNRVYLYDARATRHCRMEPNAIDPARAFEDERHVLARGPMLLHWRWWDWQAWQAHPQSATEKYRRYWADADAAPVDPGLLWPSDREAIR
jgi:hypothetical protein